MPLTNQTNNKLYYTAAVYRFEDTCVRLQEGMQGYYRTASVEGVEGIESVFRWFARRGVGNFLFTELSGSDLKTVLQRLNWDENFCKKNKLKILPYKPNSGNPFQKLIKALKLQSGLQLITVGDQPDFLDKSWAAGIKVNIGVTYGTCNYRQLERAAKIGLLDSILQLPNFIIQNGISQEKQTQVPKKSLISFASKSSKQLYLRLTVL